VGRGELRPSYYVYQLYSHFGSELVYTDSGVEDLSVFAALREDGRLTILLNNLADDEQTASLMVGGEGLETAEQWQLTQESNPDAAVDVTFSNGMVTVPGQSITLLVIDGER
jgi:hypothetical protein